MRRFVGLAALVAATGAGAAQAADPAAWLVKVSDAARQSSYQGVVVYRDERTMEVLRVAHRQKDGMVQERLTSLTGKPRDILRHDDQVACVVADEPVQAAGGIPQRLFPVMSAEILSRAAAHYDIRDLGETRVAGRACHAVAVRPRDEFRYGYEVCADAQTAVPLKVSLLDRDGRAVEELIFTEVAFPARIDDAAFALPPGMRGTAPQREQPVEATEAGGLRLDRLPPGFRVILRSRMPAADGGLVEHVLLSDGLSAVSVFGAPVPSAQAFSGYSRMGAMNAYGRTVGGLHVTVIGEVPQTTVRLIGEGFGTAH